MPGSCPEARPADMLVRTSAPAEFGSAAWLGSSPRFARCQQKDSKKLCRDYGTVLFSPLRIDVSAIAGGILSPLRLPVAFGTTSGMEPRAAAGFPDRLLYRADRNIHSKIRYRNNASLRSPSAQALAQ